MKERDKLLKELSVTFPKAQFNKSEDFNGSTDAIHTSAEEGYTKDGLLLFDYYTMDSTEETYVMGTHKEIEKVLDKYSAYAEFVDAGTVMIYL